MPREGGEALLHLVRDVVEQRAYVFGTPWLPEGGSIVVLPVLLRAVGPRTYLLAEEVPSALRAEDPGRLNRLLVWNDSSTGVLVRPGRLFRGRDTPSRATTAGVVIRARAAAEIEVRCVHPSQPLSAGAPLEFADRPAPESVYGALLAADQGGVWEAVRAAASDAASTNGGRDPSDDLVDCLVRGDRGDDGPPRTTPASPSECGAVLLDAGGVVAAEILDHPDSWRRVSREFYGRHAPRLRPAPEAALRPVANPEGAIRAASEFFVDLGKTRAGPATPGRRLVRGRLTAYVVHEGVVVHLVAEPMPPTRGAARATKSLREAPAIPESSLGHDWTVTMAPDDGETTAASASVADGDDEPGPPAPPQARRARKILTTGWDPPTLHALDAFARKEFRGDRSATVRFLVRRGVERRGYLGPQPIPDALTEDRPAAGEVLATHVDSERTSLVPRVRDLERVALATQYASWLRKRARVELERIAGSTPDMAAVAAARSALERIELESTPPDAATPHQIETPAPEPAEPPVDVAGILRRALGASLHGSFTEALALFDEVLEAEPENVTALLGRAVAFKRAGKAQEALAGFDLVLALEPGNPAALLNRGRVLRERRDLSAALETFDRLVAVALNDWDVWMERGDVLTRMGRSEEALGSFREALRRKPDDERLRAKVRSLHQARAAVPRGRFRTAAVGELEEGQSYLVRSRTGDAGNSAFRELVSRGVPGLLITQREDAVGRNAGSAAFRVAALRHARGPGTQDPRDLAALTALVERFLREHDGRGAVLLDGLDLLLAEDGSRDAILFVERVNEMVLQRRAIFIVLAPPLGVREKDLALLERSLNVLHQAPDNLTHDLGD